MSRARVYCKFSREELDKFFAFSKTVGLTPEDTLKQCVAYAMTDAYSRAQKMVEKTEKINEEHRNTGTDSQETQSGEVTNSGLPSGAQADGTDTGTSI